MRRRSLMMLAGMAGGAPEMWRFGRNGAMPNNEELPVLLFRGVFRGEREMTDELEVLVRRHGWVPEWRNGVYPFHHYHSTAHEVLAFGRGEARILLGGEPPIGREVTVRAGDIALLPCGTGHCRISASADFLVSGAYALGQRWDLRREPPDAAALARMKRLPFPAKTPVGGPLGAFWKHV